ncbi:MAG: bifunctional phosphoribosyl-AMP cyclohydrolase/phosphoribosyl-ATP diphosphatase HisIE [Acidimicrobiia bacterium]
MSENLIPAIVQDVDTRRVLMLAWMNAEARRLTEETGLVHFWSRSRQRLWRKGEESGNVLRLVEIRSDCDDDALLVLARPAGPTCHTGSDTCWAEPVDAGFARLERLWSVIDRRAADRPVGSYTTTLFEKGPDLPARKVVEEATEVLMAAKDHANGVADDHRLAEEMADLTYHLLVLIRERGLEPAAVFDVLAERER